MQPYNPYTILDAGNVTDLVVLKIIVENKNKSKQFYKNYEDKHFKEKDGRSRHIGFPKKYNLAK